MINNKQLFIPLKSDQFTNLIDISDINIFYNKNHRLIYVVKIPLIEQNFILYHVIPLSIKQSKRGIYS